MQAEKSEEAKKLEKMLNVEFLSPSTPSDVNQSDTASGSDAATQQAAAGDHVIKTNKSRQPRL